MTKFRPQLQQLEARDVPAAFSFLLGDGSTGAGLFSTPAGVDPLEQTQVLALTDLSVVKDGIVYAIEPGAVATYAYGQLLGVTATATFGQGVPQIELDNGSVQVGSYSATVAYDAADTEITFQLPDGTAGAISFIIPWGDVDPEMENQSILPSYFNLNIAGQNFTSGTANYTQSPALMFEHGRFLGVDFTLVAPQGFAYTSVSMNELNVTAMQASQPLQTIADVSLSRLGVDFAGISTGQLFHATIKVETDRAEVAHDFLLSFGANADVEAVRDAIYQELKDLGYNVKQWGTTRLSIGNNGEEQLRRVDIIFGKTFQAGQAVADNTLTGPKIYLSKGEVTATYNGDTLHLPEKE